MSDLLVNSNVNYLAKRVTFVIPAYNSELNIQDCINSIRAVGDFKIIVIDDGSSDRTSEVSDSLGVDVIRKKNGGAYQARAFGLEHVHTDYVYFLDSDDKVLPDFVYSIELLDRNLDYGCYLGSYVSVGTGLERIQAQVTGKLTALRLINCHYGFGPISASLWRTRDAKRIINCAPDALSLSRADDYEMFIRCSLISNILCGNIIMAKYNLPGGKSTKNLELSLQCTIEIASYYAKNFEVKYYSVPLFVHNAILTFRHLQVLFYDKGKYKFMISILSKPSYVIEYFIAKTFFINRSRRFR
jgi:glycosyltransferase involved in cell wall biosynthesis